jgi:hypothetical protein
MRNTNSKPGYFAGSQRPSAHREQRYSLEEIIALQRMLEDGIPDEWRCEQSLPDRDAYQPQRFLGMVLDFVVRSLREESMKSDPPVINPIWPAFCGLLFEVVRVADRVGKGYARK